MYVYHVCPTKKCSMVYRGKYAEALECPMCNAPRFKGEGAKRRPAKLFYYMSMKGYIQSLIENEEFLL